MPDTAGPRAEAPPSPSVNRSPPALKNCNGCAYLNTSDIAFCAHTLIFSDDKDGDDLRAWMYRHKPAGGLPSRYAEGCPGFEPKP